MYVAMMSYTITCKTKKKAHKQLLLLLFLFFLRLDSFFLSVLILFQVVVPKGEISEEEEASVRRLLSNIVAACREGKGLFGCYCSF
jgi:hypothetical protein